MTRFRTLRVGSWEVLRGSVLGLITTMDSDPTYSAERHLWGSAPTALQVWTSTLRFQRVVLTCQWDRYGWRGS